MVVWRNGRAFGTEPRDPGFESCQVTNPVLSGKALHPTFLTSLRRMPGRLTVLASPGLNTPSDFSDLGSQNHLPFRQNQLSRCHGNAEIVCQLPWRRHLGLTSRSPHAVIIYQASGGGWKE
ncbi:hypothetical protein Bbelb_121860 [Branchiostoma belcheri]|nr:hypothetical protein Bbelb_121860 [Branchiostoma belcheri]